MTNGCDGDGHGHSHGDADADGCWSRILTAKVSTALVLTWSVPRM